MLPVISWLNKQLNETEIAGAVIKRAPLTEAYLTSQSHGVQGPRFPPTGLPAELAHSTPLSNTLRSLPTVSSSGRSAGGHSTMVSSCFVMLSLCYYFVKIKGSVE